MSKDIVIRMVAYTDAAGKYTPDAPRSGNEDNFFVDDDLSDNIPSHCVPDEYTTLSECGMLMVVADGMGGMNAGEVASQIAVDTVAEFFAPSKITPEMANSHEKRKKYMERVIVEADSRIKENGKRDEAHSGMGSTIIMAWIVGNELTLSWCGDSRAYRFNPAIGIELLSKDHSYVQSLVDQGVITYEDTFDHPQGNIVIRSLGDTSKKAQPETRFFNIYDGDIILLCSDGLSGVLRDKKTYDSDGQLIEGDTLEDIIREHGQSLKECREVLWKAAEQADWYDNVTVVLCEIKSGAGAYQPQISTINNTHVNGKTIATIKITQKNIISYIASILLLVTVAFGLGWKLKSNLNPEEPVINIKEKNLQKFLQVKLDSLSGVVKNSIYDDYIKNLKEKIDTTTNDAILKGDSVKIDLLEKKISHINGFLLRDDFKDDSKREERLNYLVTKILKADSIQVKEWEEEYKNILNLAKEEKTDPIPTMIPPSTGKPKTDTTTPKSELTPIKDGQNPNEITEIPLDKLQKAGKTKNGKVNNQSNK